MNFRTVLTLILGFSALFAGASKEEKTYRKLIEQYDVAVEARQVDSCASARFWSVAIENNELLRKFRADFQKDKKGAQKALKKKAKLPHMYPQLDEDVVEEMQESCDSLLSRMGIADQYVNCSLHVVSSLDPNVYTVLTDDGFAMCITTALYTKKGVDNDVLMGYVAAEFAHGVLAHHDRALFAETHSSGKGSFLLGVGLTFGGCLGFGVPIPIGGSPQKPYIPTGEPMQKYVFSYLDDQIFEADLFGMRFMENLGKGDKYLQGLRILGTDYDETFGHYFGRPDVANRIAFLSFVKENPELCNKYNEKQRKKNGGRRISENDGDHDSGDSAGGEKKKPKKTYDWAIDTM